MLCNSKYDMSYSVSKHVQVDFPSVMAKKMATISLVPELATMLPGGVVERGPALADSQQYAAIGCDLSDLEKLERSLVLCGVDFSRPTLLLSECALTYMEPERCCTYIYTL